MLFNSLEFLIFLPMVFAIYWSIRSTDVRWQNLFLLLASYTFYGWWDYRFLGLIIFSSFVDFSLGQSIEKSSSQRKKKVLLSISVIANLGVLGFFKYFNFFAENLQLAFSKIGYEIDDLSLSIILPVGISFYTFQTMSYTIDVYRRDIKASKDPISFFCYVSFFPQLVAGPIERAKNLLPQIISPRKFTYQGGVDGCRQILIGFFKKVVIADNCAYFVNPVFENYEAYDSWSLTLAAVLFSFQIYGDFSGYSDIAIGTSKLFGINLKQNFRTPYFSRNIAEFWRRWHISLSSWFKDYLYIPLGGSRINQFFSIRNVLIIFIVSGFWHGANWTFIVWGLINGLLIIPSFIIKNNRKFTRDLPSNVSAADILRIVSTFVLTTVAWIIFRSDSMEKAVGYLSSLASNIGSKSVYNSAIFFEYNNIHLMGLGTAILFLLVFDWINRSMPHSFSKVSNKSWVRYLIYFIMMHCITKDFFSDQPFIYFQF